MPLMLQENSLISFSVPHFVHILVLIFAPNFASCSDRFETNDPRSIFWGRFPLEQGCLMGFEPTAY